MGVSGVSKSHYRARMGFKYQTVYFLFFLFTPTPPPLAHSVPACLSVINLSRCSLPVTYLVVVVVFFFPFCLYSGPPPTPSHLSLSLPIPSSHALHMRAHVFTEQLCHIALSPCNLSPCQSHRGEFWTSGCCWVTAHGCSVFGAKSQRGSKVAAKAFRFACGHYYKVKHLSPSSSRNIIYLLSLALLTD